MFIHAQVDMELVVWRGAHHVSVVDFVYHGADIEHSLAEAKIQAIMKEKGFSNKFKLERIRVKRQQIIYFYSHLPHAGAKNSTTKKRWRIFGMLAALNPRIRAPNTEPEFFFLMPPNSSRQLSKPVLDVLGGARRGKSEYTAE